MSGAGAHMAEDVLRQPPAAHRWGSGEDLPRWDRSGCGPINAKCVFCLCNKSQLRAG